MWTWAATLLIVFVCAQSAPVSTNNDMQMKNSATNSRSKRFAHDFYNYLASHQQAYPLDGLEGGSFANDIETPHKRFSDLVNYLHMYQQEPQLGMAYADKEKKDEPDALSSAAVGWNLLNLNSFENE
uniref:Uncharacterized protein n=1 Tax=Plectus sambesii TaxID=2011161 RepID=A0A914WJE6_9BILA